MPESNEELFKSIIHKDMDWDSIFQEMSDRLMEDEFNCPIAEQALDIACDVYPDEENGKPLCQDYLMEVRHEFVSDFMEYCRCEYIKQCASNLGMLTKEEATESADLRAKEITKMWKDRISLQAKNFSEMSAYQFSKWKLDYDKTIPDWAAPSVHPNPFGPMPAEDHVVQDSEDEAWEQLMAFQKANFKDV